MRIIYACFYGLLASVITQAEGISHALSINWKDHHVVRIIFTYIRLSRYNDPPYRIVFDMPAKWIPNLELDRSLATVPLDTNPLKLYF